MAIDSFTVHNLISEPSFEVDNMWAATSNAASFTYDTSIKFDGTRSAKLVSNTGGETLVQNNTSINLIKGHTYYVCVHKYESGSLSNIQFYWPIAEPSFGTATGMAAAQNKWVRYSLQTVRNNWNNGLYPFRIDFENQSQSRTCWLDGCMLIDLTADFGAGNEPTKDWCDVNIPFFVGTYKNISPICFKDNGTWREGKELYFKINGTWAAINLEDAGKYITEDSKLKAKYVYKKYDGYGNDENTRLLLHGDGLTDYAPRK